MDFYNEFLERLRKGEDANVIANEITKALNDSIKAKAEEDEVAKKARCARVKAAEDDMNDFLDVMIEYVNDYLGAYADAHDRENVESMDKDELRSLLDSWAELHGWINKVSKMDMSDVLDELGSLWADLSIAEKVGVKSQPSADIYAKTNVSTDDLDKIYGKTNVKADLNDVAKASIKRCDCDKECDKSVKKVKKSIPAMKVNIARENVNSHPTDENYARVMSADDIIKEFLKALDKF